MAQRRAGQTRAMERAENDRMWQAKQYLWNTNRAALLAEYTEVCPFCSRELEPIAHEAPAQTFGPGHVWIARRTKCGCAGEQAAIAAQRQQQAATHKDRRQAAWVWALQRAGLEGRLASASFETYKAKTAAQKKCLHQCKQYAHDLVTDNLRDKPWLVLTGQYGAGKTHLAAAIVREALGNGWSQCYFRPWLSYLRRLMDSFGDDAEERTADVARELAAGKLVVIDDIDNDRASVSRSGFAETELFRAIDDRYRANLPTILTFNRTPLEMVPWLGYAGVDRLTQYSYAVVEFSGVSYRSGQEWGNAGQAAE